MTDNSQLGHLDNARVLMYSHDTFGLGHLRRCQTLAHHLIGQYKGLSVLILTGSPIIGRFEFKVRVDFVRIPGVIKLRNGDYTSLGLHLNLEHTLALRESIIHHTADIFDPDLFIVDKEPLGLKGEVESTLITLKEKGTPIVLGVRDVLDAPHLLRTEWAEKKAIPALERYYDELWVYGDESMGSPFRGLDIPEAVQQRVHYTGYLQRHLPTERPVAKHLSDIPRPYLLVTPGGGADGEEMVDGLIRAYERTDNLPWHGLFVVGPFMSMEKQEKFRERINRLDNASFITFDNYMESLIDNAAAVVAMGGYNTFCEILSFDKPALIIPRVNPREEQLIRAQNAAKLGLVGLLDPNTQMDDNSIIEALTKLADQPKPSTLMPEKFMSGLEQVSERFSAIIHRDK